MLDYLTKPGTVSYYVYST